MKEVYGYMKYFLLIVFLFLINNCATNSTDPNEDKSNQTDWKLAGAWNGSNFEVAPKADSTQRLNLSAYGVVFSIVVYADSSYVSNTTILNQTTTETGIVEVDSVNITLNTSDSKTHYGTYHYTDSGVSILMRDEEFDIDNDGVMETYYLFIDLVKI